LELDPMCFKSQAPKSAPPELVPDPTYFPPRTHRRPLVEPDFPLEEELAKPQGYARSATDKKNPNDHRSPTPKPIEDSSVPRCQDEPSEQEVLAALKMDRTLMKDDVEIIFEKVVDQLDPPRMFPLVGQAQLHHCHWKCTVHYTESIGMNWPLKIGFKLHRVAVVYVDKDGLKVVQRDGHGSLRQTNHRRTKLLVEGQWREVPVQ
jgi:hypothetical protein